jgi:hypothetical protein
MLIPSQENGYNYRSLVTKGKLQSGGGQDHSRGEQNLSGMPSDLLFTFVA